MSVLMCPVCRQALHLAEQSWRCEKGHHYEKQGWKETQVVIRFWIITIFLVVLGLMTLKLR